MGRKKCVVCGESRELSEISYHRFPNNIETKHLWIRAVNIDENLIYSHSVICSGHFNSRDIITAGQRRTLLSNAVPFSSLETRSDGVHAENISVQLTSSEPVAETLSSSYIQDGEHAEEMPYDLDLKKKWAAAFGVGLEYFSPGDRVCSDHFKTSDYIYSPTSKRLKESAVPYYKPFSSLSLSTHQQQEQSRAKSSCPSTVLMNSPDNVSEIEELVPLDKSPETLPVIYLSDTFTPNNSTLNAPESKSNLFQEMNRAKRTFSEVSSTIDPESEIPEYRLRRRHSNIPLDKLVQTSSSVGKSSNNILKSCPENNNTKENYHFGLSIAESISKIQNEKTKLRVKAQIFGLIAEALE